MARVSNDDLNNDTLMMDQYGDMFAPGSLVAFDDDLDDTGEALGWSKSYAGEIFIYFDGEDKTYGAEPKDIVLIEAVKADANPTTNVEPEENKFKRIFNIDAGNTNPAEATMQFDGDVDIPSYAGQSEPTSNQHDTAQKSKANDASSQRTPAAAMVTPATPETLIPGVVVTLSSTAVVPRRYSRGQLFFVASYLKQTDTWKLIPVNGEIDRPGSYLKIGHPSQVEIVKVRGSL